jgi:hypothetical protein
MLRRVTVGAERRRRWILDEPDYGRGLRSTPTGVDTGVGPVSVTDRAAGLAAGFVVSTFVFGWVTGLLLVLKSWHLQHATRWLMVSGAGYVTLMLVPILSGFLCVRIAGHLIRRGWGGAPLRALALGLCGLVAGVMAI